MNPSLKSFVFKSTLLTAVFLVLGGVLYATVWKPFYLKILPGLLAFFYLFTNLIHAYLLRISGKSMSGFSFRYMAVSLFKFLLYLVVAIVFIWSDTANSKIFLANFLVLYIAYTTLEVREISSHIRQSS